MFSSLEYSSGEFSSGRNELVRGAAVLRGSLRKLRAGRVNNHFFSELSDADSTRVAEILRPPVPISNRSLRDRAFQNSRVAFAIATGNELAASTLIDAPVPGPFSRSTYSN